MDHTAIAPADSVPTLLAAIYAADVRACEAYSTFEEPLRVFEDAAAVEEFIRAKRERGVVFTYLMLHYVECGGALQVRRIALKPEVCDGATWREIAEGWGLIQLQITYREDGMAECRIAVNTEKRAHAWSSTFESLRDPAEWNWKIVEKHARRLIRVLKGLAAPATA
jgi:hypothetical protein